MGYILLGATWIVMKTAETLRKQARAFARRGGGVTLFMIGVVSILTPSLNPVYLDHWFRWPSVIFSFVMPILLTGTMKTSHLGLRNNNDPQPFLASLGFFALCFCGIGISFYPYMVPPSATICQAASPDDSLLFLLVRASVLIPMILAYTCYAYWVFRGKIPKGGYH